jgi:hypothetical protein
MKIQRRLEKISTIISLAGLALGFSVLGLLIVVKEHDSGASIIGGILGILLGAAFLMAACLHWKCCDRIQGGFQVEEVLSAEIVLKCDKLARQSVVSESLERCSNVGWENERGAGRRDADRRNYQPLAPPLWLDHTAFSAC